jgi:hypothetical protein
VWEQRPWARLQDEGPQCEVIVGHGFEFRLPKLPPFSRRPPPPLDPSTLRAEVVSRARREYPFLIRRICAIHRENHKVTLLCELPDVPEPKWLPYDLVAAVDHALVIKFLQNRLEGQSSGGQWT